MILSHMISDAVLAATGVWVFSTAFGRVSFYARLLWGFFFLTISLAALAGVITFAGLTALEPLHSSLTVLAGSLGVVAVVVATYATVLDRRLSPVSFGVSLGIGMILFILLYLPEVAVFAPVVAALGILLVMLLAVLALLRKQHWAVWIVVAVMLMAFATKVQNVVLPLHPLDAYHYLIALALVCFWYAMRKRDQAL
ncbi:DUF6962 family protein [uncultured Fibrella sp.]|uniref:DUF6962 family protein n=1 Tax=uncultured Fibrella sp. TaxID=1284596 RepID=UPI0035C9E8F6